MWVQGRARETALAECGSRGGSECVVRAWGCNGQVIEEGLALDRAARLQIQQGLQAAGFDPGGADGLFGPRTRAAIWAWQSARGARPTGYLDGPAVEALRTAGGSGLAVATVTSAPPAATAPQSSMPTSAQAAAAAELEGLFWQSIMNSTNPAEFEAYLEQFPNGVFRALAQARLSALHAPAGATPAVASPAPGTGVSGTQVSGSVAESTRLAGNDARLQPGAVFRDCEVCPEMVVVPSGGLALGRYELTVGEYRVFASATGGSAGGECVSRGNVVDWRAPGFPQTEHHPVTCMSWDDAQQYVSWLSRTTGARYRLPTEEEWRRAAGGSRPGCYEERIGRWGTCPVGTYGANGMGLSDMIGNVFEWTQDCWEGDCDRRVLRGCSIVCTAEGLRGGYRGGGRASRRLGDRGFRVARTLN